MRKIGSGQLTSGGECRGTLRLVESIEDVLRLLKTDLAEVIVLTHSASATAITPLFPKIKGLVCTAGGPTSHLAIVAREFDLPCLMACEIPGEDALDGRLAAMTAAGEILLEG
jgi:phosphoenolpyruvate-protein kinase (PTS system EI component)